MQHDTPPNMSSMDDATAALILQLLHEDSQNAVADMVGKGKQVAGAETDNQMAMRLFLEEEVQKAETLVADRIMTRSLQTAVRLDGEACVLAQRQERMATHDRDLSISLSGSHGGAAAGSAVENKEEGSGASDTDDYEQLIEKMAHLYVAAQHTDDIEARHDNDDNETSSFAGDQPESSAWAASREAGRAPQLQRQTTSGHKDPMHQCNSCMERKHHAELATVPCKHEYCRDCLQQLFRHAITDEVYFPPRCCKLAIRPGHQIRLFLTGNLVREFEFKAVEFSTPRRTYCHDPSCAAFVPPSHCLNAVATCTLCARQTCTTCKQAAHGGDCPNDDALQSVIELARQQGWQRCQQCWSMVDLSMGCNHMSCRCGFQFCYVCGAEWKTCQCDQWDERRLFERAAEIDARHHPRVARERPNPRIAALMEDLRINHECTHERWRGRPGPRRCEECFHLMPQFIYECRQCHVMACRRCRFHRM
ncbi:uncharacterized protein B0I36DRAFT_286721 [Microdochium trichocladiopsis]|uniref:RBR-type E3 ubiquitin transferase n=1 Tax=Microdochium trichocladiopsis TaxID=1682393 RepID=A0A9P8Y7K0_9PEZI|nr:uncharacterized protein B0I36DRAFT_286721 [Microdochium trichocladiopsis]KAH7032629.1 hypothetical protein B0I36DRAFT_286721 [Microdochium trichocladiopsis]